MAVIDINKNLKLMLDALQRIEIKIAAQQKARDIEDLMSAQRAISEDFKIANMVQGVLRSAAKANPELIEITGVDLTIDAALRILRPQSKSDFNAGVAVIESVREKTQKLLAVFAQRK